MAKETRQQRRARERREGIGRPSATYSGIMVQMPVVAQFFESPYTALGLGVLALALALSGRFSVTASQTLLVVVWAIILVALRSQPLPVLIGIQAIAGGLLVLLGYWVVPDGVPKYVGTLFPKQGIVLFGKGQKPSRILELAPGTQLVFTGPEGVPIFKLFDTSELLIELVDNKLMVSTQILDEKGDLVAELARNEWKVAPPPKTWDRNYTDDALEVRNVHGRIALQVKVLPDRSQFQGEFWGRDGKGMRFVRNSDPRIGGGTGAFIIPLPAKGTDMQIKPMFKYPSDLHFGELN